MTETKKFYAVIMGGKAQWEVGSVEEMRKHLIELEGNIVYFEIGIATEYSKKNKDITNDKCDYKETGSDIKS